MKKLIVGICMLCAGTLPAQDTLRMKDIFQHIDMHSKHLLKYDDQVRAQQEAAKGAYGWMPPELSTGVWMAPYNPSLWKRTNGMPGMGQYMVSAQQIFPNRKRQDAQAAYMQSMADETKENKNATQNDLYAEAKKNYYEWVIIKKKLNVLEQDENLIGFMIKNAEIRYRNGLSKLDAYYKAKASLGIIHSQQVMLQNDMAKKRIALNTLMHRERATPFEIDTAIAIVYTTAMVIDSAAITVSRSDIRAIDRQVNTVYLQQNLERAKLKPEFGARFDHMFGFGGLPMQYTLMGMVKLPMARWSAKENKANIESLTWKAAALGQEKEAMMNELLGMAYEAKADIETKAKELVIYEHEIIPAVQRNYQAMQIAYTQNTGELFMLYDAWEKLNTTQLEYLDQLQEYLVMQAAFNRILEIKTP